MKVAPLCILALVLSACGGGAGTPEGIGESAVSAIRDQDFGDLLGLTQEWYQEGYEQGRAKALWELKHGSKKWKEDFESTFTGDNSNDPKNKAEIDDKDKYSEASLATLFALEVGCYKLYSKEKYKDRLDTDFWLTNRSLGYRLEGLGVCTLTYKNKYGDRITVSTMREGGVLYLDKSGVSLSFAKDLPKKAE